MVSMDPVLTPACFAWRPVRGLFGGRADRVLNAAGLQPGVPCVACTPRLSPCPPIRASRASRVSGHRAVSTDRLLTPVDRFWRRRVHRAVR